MKKQLSKRQITLAAVVFALLLSATIFVVQISPAQDPGVFGVFIGSTPCDEQIRRELQISPDTASTLMEWKVTLFQDPKAHLPTRYELLCNYGSTEQGKPGLAKGYKTLKREGTWTTRKGIKFNPKGLVYDLNGAISLYEVDADVAHMLNSDQTLMVGSGWNYTLNRRESSEGTVDPLSMLFLPEMSYRISPPTTGPTVFGIFQGRTPARRIAQQLQITTSSANANKAKWRVTLFQNAEDHSPTKYKVEGSLFGDTPREGTWTIAKGIPTDKDATVYRLESEKAVPPLLLLKGDDNVVFLLDQNRKPLVGHSEFSYTLNRKPETDVTVSAK